MTADTGTAQDYSFRRDISVTHVVNALVGFLFAASGPLAIILATGRHGGLSEVQIASWVFGSLAFNGALSIGYCVTWRQPYGRPHRLATFVSAFARRMRWRGSLHMRVDGADLGLHGPPCLIAEPAVS